MGKNPQVVDSAIASKSQPMSSRLPAVAFCLIVSMTAFHCAVTQPVRVLHPEEVKLTGSLGGPIVPGTIATVIIPYATAGAAVGITQDVTAAGNVHLACWPQ